MSHITEEKYIAAAKRLYGEEGTIEVDADAEVSMAEGNPDHGAYVQAWVWVPDEEAEKVTP